MGVDTFHTRKEIRVGTKAFVIYSLRSIEKSLGFQLSHLPYSIRILLENLLRREDNRIVRKEDIENLARWNAKNTAEKEIAFMPARVLLQDFTGVPCIVDLAVMRDAMVKMGEDPNKINPFLPVDLVIDHSVQVDEYGNSNAFQVNAMLEFERNKERYAFLRWGQQAFKNFRVVPPDTGIVHQINLEYLARVVFTAEENGQTIAFPDTLVGTDSHTTMINGLGILGWGVGGIEAEAAMLGQPLSMLIPQVVGFKLTGQLKPGTTATDLVLTITQILRRKGVVGKFIEFMGPGLASLSIADRATIANMSPEYGATAAFFPADLKTIEYLRFTGREEEQIALAEAYLKEQNLFCTADSPEPEFSSIIELNLATVESCIAGPRRPQERIPISKSKTAFRSSLLDIIESSGTHIDRAALAQWVYYLDEKARPEFLKNVTIDLGGSKQTIGHGSVVIAAITSCTNTSNPSVLIAAGLLAKKAAEKGLKSKPWVKTSLAPGSKIVTEYLRDANLLESLETLGFYLVGYGCTTCIGNSGPLPEAIAKVIQDNSLIAAAVLSGNRNFEGRINAYTHANFLASPPLVIAYAIAGTMDIDFIKEPIGTGTNGEPVFLKDIWPAPLEIEQTMRKSVKPDMFKTEYSDVFEGENNWQNIEVPTGAQYTWDERSTYIKAPLFFDNLPREPKPLQDIHHARVLALFGDSITTDHISPAGSIDERTPAGRYLLSLGVAGKDFNQYGARRGNHEVMMRGTFANARLKNLLVPGIDGGFTALHPSSKEPMSIYEAAVKYKEDGIPLIIIAGKEYGSGSSRDWAAKGPFLLGVKAIIAESFERIHRSNLIGMGILPLQFEEGQNCKSLDLSGFEIFDIEGITDNLKPKKKMTVTAISQDGVNKTFDVICRIDTPNEVDYYKHGGILQFVLRSLTKQQQSAPEVRLPPKIEGSTQKYKIIFRGEIDQGHDIQAVKGDLAIFFKTTPAQIERLFTGKPVTLNTNLDHSTASDYITGMRSIGALCYFEPIQTIPIPQPPTPQAAGTPKITPRPIAARPLSAATAQPLSSKSKIKAKVPEKSVKSPGVNVAGGMLTAMVMIILFILYPLTILFIAAKLFEHIVDNIVLLDEYSLVVGIGIYILPIFIGIILLVSMVKPFFARPLSKQFYIPVFRKKEPALTNYVDKIAQSLGSILRVNIEVNYSTNVTLQYKRGLIGFLENNLSLAIGLPVISEMTMGEFTALVACEIGHFTQKIRMQVYFVITGINRWFTRVALEEDETDRKLTISSQTSGTMVSLLVPIVELFIWIGRKILTLFMIAGNKISKPYMRQAEIDGDKAAVRLAGFESLETAFGKLGVIAEGSKKAFQQLKMEKGPSDNSLPNNFIQLINSNTENISDEEIIRIKGMAIKGKPENSIRQLTFRERLDFARHVSAKPTFQSDQPASSLVTNINELSATATVQLYREVLGLQFETSSLVSMSEFIASIEMYKTSKSTEVAKTPGTKTDEPPDISSVIDSDANPFF